MKKTLIFLLLLFLIPAHAEWNDETSLNTTDVAGPASATDNAAVRYDGTTGKIVQDSSVLIDDSDNITGVAAITATTVNATTVDTNVAAAGVTLTGTTLEADGTDAAIDITVTPKGNAGVVLPNAAGAPGTTTNKLYQTGGVLYFDGVSLEAGTVSKVGTPVDNQIGVWTGDGTIEGDADFTLDTSTNTFALAGAADTSILAQGGANVLVDNPRGTLTLSNVDALDATSEGTIETAIDTLANLTSVQSQTVSLGNSLTVEAGGAAVLNQDLTTDANVSFTQVTAALAGNVDTNVAAAGVTLTGTTLEADGTDADINIAITPKGTGEVDITKVDIDSGTIDGATIATSNITVGAGKTLDVSAGTLTLANDQISGDKVEGGTINATTVNTLTSTTVNATTVDTNVAAAAVTLTGTTLEADGTDAAIDITITPKGNAGVVLPNAGGAPGTTTNKLYQTGGVLYFDGVSLEDSGISAYTGLSDTPGTFTASLIPVINDAGDAIIHDADLSYTQSTDTLSATNIAGTLSTAAQGNITSLGTLTTLTVDDITINGNGISSAGASSLTLAPTAGQKFIIDGHWGFDGAALTAEADADTTLTAYAGKNITIESVTFDGGEIGGATLVTPALGTPSSGTLTSCTGLPAAGVVGTAAVLGANTFTGAQTLGSGASIALNEKTILVDAALSTNSTWTGPTQVITAGEDLTIGEVAYLKSDGKYWLADADAEATADTKLVMATASISADATGTVLLPSAMSFMRVDATTEWTVTGAGDVMYISTTSGELTNDVSGYTTGDIVRVCGYMETATILNFNASAVFLEVE